MALRMELSRFITDCIKKLGLKQVEAAAKLNVPQSRISELTNGNIEKFTVDAMMDMLDKLGFRTHVTLPSNDTGASPQVVVTSSPVS